MPTATRKPASHLSRREHVWGSVLRRAGPLEMIRALPAEARAKRRACPTMTPRELHPPSAPVPRSARGARGPSIGV
eukprot:4991022-Pyramimonas_sp.AAC.1